MNTVNNIKPGNYSGYLWRSNSSEPELIEGEFVESLDPNINPFIVEAQLFDHDTRLSYSVKYVDGEYLIYEHLVESDDFNRTDVSRLVYYANSRIKGHERLEFLQYWEEEEDDLCSGMKVLQPKAMVFVGFNDKEE